MISEDLHENVFKDRKYFRKNMELLWGKRALGSSTWVDYLHTLCENRIFSKSCDRVLGGDIGKFSDGPQIHALYYNLTYNLSNILSFTAFAFSEILLKIIWPPDETLKYFCSSAMNFQGL